LGASWGHMLRMLPKVKRSGGHAEQKEETQE
jgi:hypothetical protein